jgi:monoterpene epsilon-lactone hydrolase
MYSMHSTGHRPIAGAILFSPELDLVLDEPSITANADRDILPWNIPTASYLHGLDPNSGQVSALDQDVSTWPPTFISFGGDEMFRDSIRRFVAKLDDAGVDVVAMEEPGMFHVFPILMPWAEGSRRAYRAVGEFVTDHVAPPGPTDPEGSP